MGGVRRKPGERLSSLVLVEYVGNGRWSMRCDCGELVIKYLGNVVSGRNRTCGSLERHPRPKLFWSMVGYVAAHKRVKAEKGPARLYPCVDCGEAGQDWSYDHLDPDEVYGQGHVGHSKPAPYSLKTAHYVSRCKSCHKFFDLARKREQTA